MGMEWKALLIDLDIFPHLFSLNFSSHLNMRSQKGLMYVLGFIHVIFINLALQGKTFCRAMALLGSPIEENLGLNPFSPPIFKPNKISPCSIGSKSPPNPQPSTVFFVIWQDLASWRSAMATLTLFPLCNLCNNQKVAYMCDQVGQCNYGPPYLVLIMCFYHK